MRYLTAGESHGKCLTGILEGVPANLKIDFDFIGAELARRQSGYGRGARMQIESDKAEFTAGIRGGVTTGSPIAFLIYNADYENWAEIIGPSAVKLNERRLTAVRPGHADLAGCIKYRQSDARNILERASARSTAATVAIGAVAKLYLKELGIMIASHTVCIGGVRDDSFYDYAEVMNFADASPVGVVDKKAEAAMMKAIDQALASGDTLGGEIKVIARGLPVGVGSFIAPEQRLEFSIMGHLGAIPSVKSVSIGNTKAYTAELGSKAHDALYYSKDKKIVRKTNNAGGIEGGISNGEDIVISLQIKPVPSVPQGIPSVDIAAGKEAQSARERGDACVVPAAGVVAEAVLATVLMQAVAENLGGDHMDEVKERMAQKRKQAL